MGLFFGKEKNDADEQIRKAQEERDKVKPTRLLLYGPGESGKTTILRQMRLVETKDLKEKERFKHLICLNVIEGAALTIQAGKIMFNLNFGDSKDADIIYEAFKKAQVPGKNQPTARINLNDVNLVKAIQTMYGHEDFQACLKRRNEYQISDGWEYFMDKLKYWPEWGGSEWSPSNEDLLRSRIRTTGKDVVKFQLQGLHYELIDVGGQKAERRKFINMFSSIDAVLFVASLSEYDQNLFEDNTMNRFTDTIELWKQSVNSDHFGKAFFLVFLNKVDLFREKFYVQKKPINPQFDFSIEDPPLPSEEKDEKCEKVLKWYEDLFKSKVNDENRRETQVRIYATTALDPQNIKRVMDLCTTLLVHRGVGAV